MRGRRRVEHQECADHRETIMEHLGPGWVWCLHCGRDMFHPTKQMASVTSGNDRNKKARTVERVMQKITLVVSASLSSATSSEFLNAACYCSLTVFPTRYGFSDVCLPFLLLCKHDQYPKLTLDARRHMESQYYLPPKTYTNHSLC